MWENAFIILFNCVSSSTNQDNHKIGGYKLKKQFKFLPDPDADII